ncbi:hypothetical protein LG358_00105 [Escherichia phage UoN_LG358_1]|nr:hypothetical protein LG358_00105 [Escherichia phage UoN_LG358_1]
MIIKQEEEQIFGSANQKASKFGIENNMKAFMVLSDKLYTNKIYAIVRELSTNCLDAHKLNGQTRPFTIKVPTRIDPRFVIRDFGPGMSDEQIRGTDDAPGLYNTYFASTKADSNDFIGAMGLGSKSPFSYTKTFTVVSCHKGRKRGYTAIMKNTGPEIIPLFDTAMEEDEYTGIEITVPVKTDDIDKWHHEVRRTLRTFAGVEPEIQGANINIDYFEEFTPEKQWFDKQRSYFDTDSNLYAIYGRIVYPIKVQEVPGIKCEWLNNKYNTVYVNFELGELDITPSREELSYNEETIEAIRNKINKIEETNLRDDIKHLESITNKRELVRELKKFSSRSLAIIGNSQSKIQGKTCREWLDYFDQRALENKMYSSNMYTYFVGDMAERRKISNSWSTRNRYSASGLIHVNQKKIVFMIDDKPNRRASTIRGMSYLNIHKGCQVILIDPNNEDHLEVVELAKKLFEGDEVVIFKASDMEQARAKDAEINKPDNSDAVKRPKSPNVHLWKLDSELHWESTNLFLTANEVRELEGLAVGINREDIVELRTECSTSYSIENIRQACKAADIKEFYTIRPSAMKYVKDNNSLTSVFNILADSYADLIDDVLDDLIHPHLFNIRRFNAMINIKALNPLLKNFISGDNWEKSLVLNQMAEALNCRSINTVVKQSKAAKKIALCYKIYNKLILSSKSDFNKASDEFAKKYPVIWYMLEEYYISREEYYTDIMKIAALQGAI